MVSSQLHYTKVNRFMPFLLAEILNFQSSTHRIGVGSFSKIEEKKVVDSVDIKTAVIYRLNDLIKQKDITVNEAAVRSGVPPSTLKNILYGQSRNAGVVTIKKICDGLDITIQEFFEDPIFADLEPEL